MNQAKHTDVSALLIWLRFRTVSQAGGRQAFCVVLLWCVENGGADSAFDDAAGFHDDDAVRDLLHRGELVTTRMQSRLPLDCPS